LPAANESIGVEIPGQGHSPPPRTPGQRPGRPDRG
jgi:hypothetical protein